MRILRQVRPLGILVALAAAAAAAVPAPSRSAEVPKVADTLAQRLLACAICHGEKGEGLRRNEYYPRLAGKPRDYLYNQLLNFRDKRRAFPIMNYMVAYLSDAYLLEIADHYARQQPPYPEPVRGNPDDVARGGRLVMGGDPARKLPACAACHGKALTGVEPAIPGLLGLYPAYITSQLGAWRDNKRHAVAPDCMRDMANALTPDDIGAITAYLAAQPVPADARPAPAASVKLPLECGGLSRK